MSFYLQVSKVELGKVTIIKKQRCFHTFSCLHLALSWTISLGGHPLSSVPFTFMIKKTVPSVGNKSFFVKLMLGVPYLLQGCFWDSRQPCPYTKEGYGNTMLNKLQSTCNDSSNKCLKCLQKHMKSILFLSDLGRESL